VNKQNVLSAYILIGIGLYFLMKQFDIPLLANFYGWSTIMIIVGVALLLYSFRTKDAHNIFSGVIVLGIGIHFHGLDNYTFWSNHWAVYILIVGLAFIVRSLWSKEGMMTGIVLTVISSLFIFSWSIPHWLTSPMKHIHTLWPIAIILLGIYLLRKK